MRFQLETLFLCVCVCELAPLYVTALYNANEEKDDEDKASGGGGRGGGGRGGGGGGGFLGAGET